MNSTQSVSPDITGQIRAEQVRTLLSHVPLVLVGTLFAAAAVVLVLFTRDLERTLLFWMMAVIILSVLRCGHYMLFKARAPSIAAMVSWGWQAAGLALLSGGLWAFLPPLIISPDDPFAMISLVIFLVGMLSGSLISQSVFLPAFLAYCLPVMLSLSAALWLAADQFSYLAALGLVFCIVLVGFAINANRVFKESIQIRFENLRLVEELKAQTAAAERANQAKSQFLAAASHDLRQPLHAAGLYTGALQQALETDQQRALTEKVSMTIGALEELLGRILDISRLDAGTVEAELAHFPMADLVQRLQVRFQPVADEQDVALNVQCDDSVVRSDPLLLERILDNLLSNAFRYTQAGCVDLAVHAAPGHVAVTIADSGCGIPAAERENVFREFYQLHNPERDRAKGLGLGLSIVRRLCELLGIELDLDSAVDEGTRFALAVPQGDPAKVASRGAKPMRQSWDLAATRVLVIDDERDVRSAMDALLSTWGCDVVTADSLQDALRKTNGQSPDLVISDYRLGGGASGIDAVLALQARREKAMPAVLITGDTATDRLQEASSSGLPVLHKPVNPAQLRTVMNQLLRESGA